MTILLADGKPDWPCINRAILERWSMSGLEWIKRRAWKDGRREEGSAGMRAPK